MNHRERARSEFAAVLADTNAASISSSKKVAISSSYALLLLSIMFNHRRSAPSFVASVAYSCSA